MLFSLYRRFDRLQEPWRFLTFFVPLAAVLALPIPTELKFIVLGVITVDRLVYMMRR